MAKFFEKKDVDNFDLFGVHWDKCHFNCYKGYAPSKATLKNYKFCICFENITNVNGYISEKIFDCLQYGCVPIYWRC